MIKYGEKQRQLLRMWQKNELRRINILEGSVRSGKTWISLVLWAFWVATMPKDASYLMVAKTLTSLRRNCLNLLERLVGSKNFTYSLPKKEARLFGRLVYLEGVNDSRAESKIRGMTLQGALCDELTLFTEDFFAMLLSRLSMPGAKLFGSTNPDNPNHWLMEKYIKRQGELDMLVMKFLIDDNASLDPEYVAQLKKEYTGVYYDRFILGKWVVADGIIYRQFADDPDHWTMKKPEGEDFKRFCSGIDFVSVGVDFGGNRSLTTFVATAVHRGFSKLTVLRDYHIEGQKGDIDSDKVNREFVGFIQRLKQEYPGARVKYCFADSEAQYLINGMRRASNAAGLGIQFGDSAKNEITQRIYCTSTLLNLDRLFLMNGCNLVSDGLKSAVWDKDQAEKGKDVRLDNFSSDIDILDAFEYSWERFMRQLLPDKR